MSKLASRNAAAAEVKPADDDPGKESAVFSFIIDFSHFSFLLLT